MPKQNQYMVPNSDQFYQEIDTETDGSFNNIDELFPYLPQFHENNVLYIALLCIFMISLFCQ